MIPTKVKGLSKDVMFGMDVYPGREGDVRWEREYGLQWVLTAGVFVILLVKEGC